MIEHTAVRHGVVINYTYPVKTLTNGRAWTFEKVTRNGNIYTLVVFDVAKSQAISAVVVETTSRSLVNTPLLSSCCASQVLLRGSCLRNNYAAAAYGTAQWSIAP